MSAYTRVTLPDGTVDRHPDRIASVTSDGDLWILDDAEAIVDEYAAGEWQTVEVEAG